MGFGSPLEGLIQFYSAGPLWRRPASWVQAQYAHSTTTGGRPKLTSSSKALLTSKEGLQLALGADEPPLDEEGEDDGEEDDDEDAFSPPYTPLQLPTRAR